MDSQFRKRSAGEIISIARKNVWFLVLPMLVALAAVLIVVPGLPNIYRSTTFLTLTPATISEKVAPSLTDETVSQRLQSIGSNVRSRSSIEELIDKFNLYPERRAAGVPAELIVEEVNSNILVEPEKSDQNQIVGFRISYRYINPVTTQAMTAELANRYISAQSQESRQSAETTKEFIDEQMAQAKAQLDELERQRLGIMIQNVDTLPESSQGLIAQLEGLRTREQTISKDKENLMNERGRIQESIRALNSQMRLIENYGEKETQEAVAQASRIEDTPAYAQLIQKRAELNAKLANLRKQFREKHPEVVQAEIEIQKINDELDKLARTTGQRVQQVNASVARKAELQRKGLEIERDKAESQIGLIGQQLQSKDDELRQNSMQINSLEAKINTIPGVKVSLEGVNNQYASAKANYDEIAKKFNSAQQQVQRETNEQGEAIQVVDPANLPETAENANKKPLFLALGAGAGLAFGLLLVGFLEGPKLLKIQNIADTEHYTGLPVLATIPPLLDEQEVSHNRTMGYLRLSAGVAAAVISVPILVVAMNMTRILERLS